MAETELASEIPSPPISNATPAMRTGLQHRSLTMHFLTTCRTAAVLQDEEAEHAAGHGRHSFIADQLSVFAAPDGAHATVSTADSSKAQCLIQTIQVALGSCRFEHTYGMPMSFAFGFELETRHHITQPHSTLWISKGSLADGQR